MENYYVLPLLTIYLLIKVKQATKFHSVWSAVLNHAYLHTYLQTYSHLVGNKDHLYWITWKYWRGSWLPHQTPLSFSLLGLATKSPAAWAAAIRTGQRPQTSNHLLSARTATKESHFQRYLHATSKKTGTFTKNCYHSWYAGQDCGNGSRHLPPLNQNKFKIKVNYGS